MLFGKRNKRPFARILNSILMDARNFRCFLHIVCGLFIKLHDNSICFASHVTSMHMYALPTVINITKRKIFYPRSKRFILVEISKWYRNVQENSLQSCPSEITGIQCDDKSSKWIKFGLLQAVGEKHQNRQYFIFSDDKAQRRELNSNIQCIKPISI